MRVILPLAPRLLLLLQRAHQRLVELVDAVHHRLGGGGHVSGQLCSRHGRAGRVADPLLRPLLGRCRRGWPGRSRHGCSGRARWRLGALELALRHALHGREGERHGPRGTGRAWRLQARGHARALEAEDARAERQPLRDALDRGAVRQQGPGSPEPQGMRRRRRSARGAWGGRPRLRRRLCGGIGAFSLMRGTGGVQLRRLRRGGWPWRRRRWWQREGQRQAAKLGLPLGSCSPPREATAGACPCCRHVCVHVFARSCPGLEPLARRAGSRAAGDITGMLVHHWPSRKPSGQRLLLLLLRAGPCLCRGWLPPGGNPGVPLRPCLALAVAAACVWFGSRAVFSPESPTRDAHRPSCCNPCVTNCSTWAEWPCRQAPRHIPTRLTLDPGLPSRRRRPRGKGGEPARAAVQPGFVNAWSSEGASRLPRPAWPR